MNCETAFDYLTDPVLNSSPELRRHLDECPRCREMEEVLSPALTWMTEAALDDEAIDSPRPSAPFLTAETLAVADRLAAQLARDSETRRELVPSTFQPQFASRSWSRWRAGGVVAMLLLAGFGGWFLGAAANPDNTSTSAVCLWTNREWSAAAVDQSAKAITMSCLACHLAASTSSL
ncbi:MAG: hypothetical protein KF777_03705 [Planctomycetaceae bacterium]|nr:hypothetical protein [Planctomycetaceae bacterium]